MTEVEEIKQHIHRMVENSGIVIPVLFVESTTTNSTGCFKGGSFELEFSIPRLLREMENQANLGNPFPSHLHLADIVMAHELGHAKDQLNRNFVAKLQEINTAIWKEANAFNKQAMKTHCKAYATYNQNMEQVAWDYAPSFMLLTHDEQTVRAYMHYCLTSYQRYYPYHFKMHGYALRLMEQWQNDVKDFPNQIFNYNVVANGFTGYDKQTNVFDINIPHLSRTKPTELALSPARYLFFESFYRLVKDKFANYELERSIGKLILSIPRKGYTIEERLMMAEFTERKRVQVRNVFAYIGSKLKTISPDYLQFKTYKLKELEEDLQDNYDYIDELIAQYKDKQKAS